VAHGGTPTLTVWGIGRSYVTPPEEEGGRRHVHPHQGALDAAVQIRTVRRVTLPDDLFGIHPE
jgi:hypothetical protein